MNHRESGDRRRSDVFKEAVEPEPLVSIVIPVYNGANYLREAIESALLQTHPNIEIIVVNDGSNDGGRTREVASSFGGRIRYCEKNNGGVATALNLGIREMRGAYFSWLSHDDVYNPTKIARQLAQRNAIQDDKAILFCNYNIIDHASCITGMAAVDGFALNNSILAILGTYVNGCSLLIPRDAFKVAGLFNESLRNCQDNELWLRMVMHGYRLYYLPDALIGSRKHAGQGSLTTSVRHHEETCSFFHWAIHFVGRPCRLEDATGLFRILLMKRLPSVAAHLFRVLTDDRSLLFAVSSVSKGVLLMTAASITRKLLMARGRLVDALKKIRFRSSSAYWEHRYRSGETSGVGSYGRYADYKAEVLNAFVVANRIVRVAEFGCGDGNQLKKFTFTQYLGVDISPAAVEMCKRLFQNDPSKAFLVYTGEKTVAAIRQFGPALTISLDVIYHLVEDSVFEDHITNLFRLSSEYVIIYSTNVDRRYDFPHQLDRNFTDYIEKNIEGWTLMEVMTNRYKGAETQSDFYIYTKTQSAPGELTGGVAPAANATTQEG